MTQLGVILTPYGAHSPYGWYSEIAQVRGGQGNYLPQPGPYPVIDRFYSTRGSVGYYYDTQLGAWRKPSLIERVKAKLGLGDMIPTDAEMAKTYSWYTPVHSGWINTPSTASRTGTAYLPNPWRFGWNPAGKYGPPTALSGLGQGASAEDAIMALKEHQAKMFRLQALTAAAVSISALIATYRQLRLIRRDFGRRRRAKGR